VPGIRASASSLPGWHEAEAIVMTETHPASVGLAATSLQEHPDCFVCGPAHPAGLGLRFVSQADGSVVAEFDCDAMHQGYPRMIHGGIVACLLDGAMTHCLFAQGHAAVTGDLRVRYRHPLDVGTPAIVRAWVTKAAPPLFVMAAEVSQLGRVKAKATAKFMRRRAAR
jgi:uncharacterized protein (TIGR00369 family)